MEKTERRSQCPISFSLDFLGDKWTLLIIRDMVFAGKRSYNEFLASPEGIATNILSARLKALQKQGLIYKQDSSFKKSKKDFFLTEKGISLLPILIEMVLWGERYNADAEKNEIFENIKKDKLAVIQQYQESLSAAIDG